MTKIVHLHTTIQTVFGVVDEHDNVITQEPVIASVGPLENLLLPDIGEKAHTAIIERRDQLIANMNASADPTGSQAEVPPGNGNGNRQQRRSSAKRAGKKAQSTGRRKKP